MVYNRRKTDKKVEEKKEVKKETKNGKIAVSDFDRILEVLKAVEGKTRSRILAPNRIRLAVEEAEKRLSSLNIDEKFWEGTEIDLLPSKIENKYYKAEGTFAHIKRENGQWIVSNIERKRAGYRNSGDTIEKTKIKLSDIAKIHIPTEIELSI